MAFLTYLFCLIVKALVIQCDKNISVTVPFCRNNSICTVAPVTEVWQGENVSLLFKRRSCDKLASPPFQWSIRSSDNTFNLNNNESKNRNQLTMKTVTIKKHMNLTFRFRYSFSALPNEPETRTIVSKCSTEIRSKIRLSTNVSSESITPKPNADVWVYVGSAIGALLSVTIITQTVIILKLKAKAKLINREKKFSSRQSSADDSARYIKMPAQKALKQEKPENVERDSQIYECVEILTTGKPEPPAISTLPRRREATPIPTKPISARPPVPLPIEEEYEDMNIVHKIFKPPAFNEIVQGKIQPTKVPPARYPKPDSAKPATSATYRGPASTLTAVKPKLTSPVNATPVTIPRKAYKPPPTNEVANELDTVLKKRLNVINIPVQQIGDGIPCKKMGLPLKPNPLPVAAKKPLPSSSVKHSEPSQNEENYSSDEEWTYEPLKPISF